MKDIYRTVLVFFALSVAGFAQAENVPQAVQDAFRRTESICRDVEKVRCLKFEKKINTEVQSRADFNGFVKKSIDEQYGKDESVWFVKALVRIGALEKEMDLTETLLKILEGQAAAHYDPETKKCYLLITDMNAMMLDMVLSHELYHALQDQHFNLYDFVIKDKEAVRDNGDATAGKECLIEGDATYVMTAWMLLKQAGLKDAAALDPMVSMAINMQGAMDYDTMLNMTETMADASLGGLATSIKEMKDMPRYFMENLYSVYMQGAMMVNFLKTKGGWTAVNELYKNPPQSTEQVLHPEKLIGKRDIPVNVRMTELNQILPGKWVIKEEDVMGELGIRILLSIWADKDVKDPVAISTASAGWGGDRYYLLVNDETKGELLVWKTVWDTVQDAGEFVTTYRMLLSSRFPKMRKAAQSKPGSDLMYQLWEVEPGRFVKLVQYSETIGVLDSNDRSCLDMVWK